MGNVARIPLTGKESHDNLDQLTEKQSKTRGQHFIPQLLLRGFASRIKAEEYYTFRFPKSGTAHEVNIRNLAKARDFHGNPTESSLEDLIADFEGRFGDNVRYWRTEDTPIVEPAIASDFVAHIAIRTKHLRDGAAESLSMMLDGLADNALTTKKSLENLKKTAVKQAKQQLRDAGVLIAFKKKYRGYWERVLQTKVEEIFRNPEPLTEFQSFLNALRSNTDVKEIAANAQKRALQQAVVPKGRAEVFRELRWSVQVNDREAFILGDLGPVAYSANGSSGAVLSIAAEEVDTIALPIGSERVLIGRKSGAAELSVDRFNTCAAELSREFFVAGKNTRREVSYQTLLGTRSKLISEAEIDSWF